MKRRTFYLCVGVSLLVLTYFLNANQSDSTLLMPPPTPPDWRHWLGTDDRGRDVLARLMVGYRNSFTFAFLVSALGALLGFVLGSLQALFGGKIDFVLCRVEEAATSIPFIVILLYLSTRFSGELGMLFLIWSANTSLTFTYLVRSEVLRVKEADFLTSARLQGASLSYLLRTHLFPIAATPLLSYFPVFVAGHMCTLAAMDYLGLGLPPPTPTLGELFRQGRDNLSAWWLLGPTSVLLCGTLLGLQQMTERMRRRWNLR